jgi:hypothetical protein
VPLSDLQSEILRLLAAHRNPESYVAGSTPLNRDGPRFSQDIDVFHSREEAVAKTALADAALLGDAGYTIQSLRQEPGIYGAAVQRRGESTRLEWVRDSDFRFFPLVRDELFGYSLHIVDIATNKAMAAAGRSAPRDVLDLLYIHERHLPLGAVVWAAVEKAPGFTPEGLIAEIRRNARYRADEYAALAMAEPACGPVARPLAFVFGNRQCDVVRGQRRPESLNGGSTSALKGSSSRIRGIRGYGRVPYRLANRFESDGRSQHVGGRKIVSLEKQRRIHGLGERVGRAIREIQPSLRVDALAVAVGTVVFNPLPTVRCECTSTKCDRATPRAAAERL